MGGLDIFPAELLGIRDLKTKQITIKKTSLGLDNETTCNFRLFLWGGVGVEILAGDAESNAFSEYRENINQRVGGRQKGMVGSVVKWRA